MDRKKSLGILIVLMIGLFLIGGCGNNTEEGIVEAGGATVLVTALDITGEGAEETNNTFVPEGGSVIIQAKVTVTRKTVDKEGKAEYVTDFYAGQQVTFVVISNNSGATLTPMNGGITNSDGIARAVYKAGRLKPGVLLQDVVQAHIGGYSGQIVITRQEYGVEGSLSLTLGATSLAVKAGESSVITATVTRVKYTGADYTLDSVPVSGQTVTFSFVTNNSGGSLSTVSAVTDGSGRATVTYTAGSRSPGIEVIDSIQASSGGSTSAIAITRTEGQGYGITLTADPDKFGGNWQGVTVQSVLTAKITSDSKELSGQTVTFTIISGGGSLSKLSAVTDGTGTAVVNYSRYVSENTGAGQTVIFVVIKARLSSGAEAEARIGIGTYTEG